MHPLLVVYISVQAKSISNRNVDGQHAINSQKGGYGWRILTSPTRSYYSKEALYIKEKVYVTLFVNRNNFRKWNLTSKQSWLNFPLWTNWKSHSFNRKSISSMALVNVRRIAFKLVSERKGRAFLSDDFEKASVSFTASKRSIKHLFFSFQLPEWILSL